LAIQYFRKYNIDIQIIVQIEKTGKIFIFNSKIEDWPLSENQLVDLNKVNLTVFYSVTNLTTNTNYPVPIYTIPDKFFFAV